MSLQAYLNVDVEKMKENNKKKELEKLLPKNCREPKIPETLIERRQRGDFGLGGDINTKEVQKEARKLKLKVWGRKGYGWGVWSDFNANLWVYEIDYSNYDFDSHFQKGVFLKFSHKISHKISKKVDIPLPEHTHVKLT